MEYQNYLRRVGHEGSEIIDAQMQSCKHVYPGPQTHTVLQKPCSNSTTYVYQVQPKVPAGKAPVPPSKDVAFRGNGRRNADQDYLRRVAHEGFEIIDAFYGPSRNPPPASPPEYHPQHCKCVYNGPRTQMVLQEPFSNSTTYVYQVQTQFDAGKQAYQAPVPASEEVVFNSNGRRNAYQVPHLQGTRSLCRK